MEDDYQVLKVDEEPRFDDLGKMEVKMRVMFKVGEHGPFFRRYRQDEFNAFQVKQDLEAFARELRTLKGGT